MRRVFEPSKSGSAWVRSNEVKIAIPEKIADRGAFEPPIDLRITYQRPGIGSRSLKIDAVLRRYVCFAVPIDVAGDHVMRLESCIADGVSVPNRTVRIFPLLERILDPPGIPVKATDDDIKHSVSVYIHGL